MKEDIIEKYENSGFNGAFEIEGKVGILVVDFQIGFTDPTQSPLAGDFSEELSRTSQLLDKAREKNVPIFFCVVGYGNENEAGIWFKKVPSLSNLKLGSPLLEVDPRLKRQSNETLIVKKYASAFAGTNFASLLIANGISTLFITGITTSGCIRASVVDSVQNGIIPFVIKDAVGDRAKEPHESNLFDMQAKYAELLMCEEAISFLQNEYSPQ
ncbi:isochorismatase family protein [Jeotgalibacillus soli]|nr:isochorismatase family protein [Jeotgalibacillus soli]